jgi:hypothetical protein
MRCIVALIVGVPILVHTVVSLAGGPASVETAEQRLVTTKRDLATALAANQTISHRLAQELLQGRPGAELADFVRSTERIEDLAGQLDRDVRRYCAARDATLAAMQQKLNAIRDVAARAHVLGILDEAERRSDDRIRTAHAVLSELRSALARAADVGHTANALRLARELRGGTEELARKTEHARAMLYPYQDQTAALLARLQPLLGG